MFGMSYFIYRILDEMDGKQARKTGNSSPLGMLFDHGCDAFSIGFVLMVSAKFLNMGDTIQTLLFVAGANAVFHFSTLEEYYIGGLWLGPGNFITDLCFPLMGIYFYIGIETNAVT